MSLIEYRLHIASADSAAELHEIKGLAHFDGQLSAAEKQAVTEAINKKFAAMRAVERAGTGIANARKRLEHLYPGKHYLDINTDGDYFTVQLNLKA